MKTIKVTKDEFYSYINDKDIILHNTTARYTEFKERYGVVVGVSRTEDKEGRLVKEYELTESAVAKIGIQRSDSNE